MIINRRGDDIVRQWQNELDLGLETGDPPLLNLNAGRSGLDSLPAILAFDRLEQVRRDMAPPLAAAGGVSLTWLLALLHARDAATPLRSQGGVVAYSGPDAATHAAGLATLGNDVAGLERQAGDLSPAFKPVFEPNTLSGAQPWELLPFALVGQGENLPRDGWTAWVAVVAVLMLLIFALLT